MFQTLAELLAWTPPKEPEIIGSGVLPVKGKLVLAGEEGSFKTMFSLNAIFLISSGLSLLGLRTVPTRVGMLQVELSQASFQKRVRKFIENHKSLSSQNPHFATEADIKLDKPTGIAKLAAEVQKLGIQLLIIDPLYKVFTGDVSNWGDMARLLDNLDKLCWRYNCAVWLVHHKRKLRIVDNAPADYGTDELVGSSALKDWADSIIRFTVKGQDDILVEFLKTRTSEDIIQAKLVHFNRATLGFELVRRQEKEITVL